ncbi:PKD domain-containing protein [Candidatus Peregrinibacteria bacterium]|nr:PKD domain-containing protein [Candidatus Peregrinibacteria bacterium]
MFIHRQTFLWIGVSAAIGFLSLGTTLVTAFETNPNTSEESLSITAGDVFEILAVSDIRLPRYSWILTRNRQFLQAGQTAAFRNRFLEPGTYTLNGQIQGEDGTILSHTISISVTPRSNTYPEEPADTTLDQQALARTIPFQNSANRIILNDNKKTLLLMPLRSSLALDLLPSIDTNGDGIPQNDQDTLNTFFQEEGTPLFLWIASPLTEKTLMIHDTLDPTITPQMVRVVSRTHAESQNMLTGEIQITHITQNDRSVAFSIAFEGDTQPGIPLLYEWNFDDGEKSLVNAPVHTFVKSGTYNVNVHLRNLNTNETVATAQIPITAGNDAPAPETPIPPPLQEQEPEESPMEGAKSFLPVIGVGAGIILGLVILGTGILFILKKIKRGRSTATIVARLEEKVVKEKDEEEPRLSNGQTKSFPIDQPDKKVTAFEEAATPTWLKKEEQTNSPSSADSTSSRPSADAAVVPPWLSGTPKTSPSTPPTIPPPAPKPVAPPVPVAPQPVAPPPPPPPKKPVPPITAPTPPPLPKPTIITPPKSPTPPTPVAPLSPPKPVTPSSKPPITSPKPPISPPIPPTAPPPKPPMTIPSKETNEAPIAFVHVDSIQPTKSSEPLKSPPPSLPPTPPKDSQVSKAMPIPAPIPSPPKPTESTQPKKEDQPWI